MTPDILRRAVEHTGAYLDRVADRPVNATMSAAELRSALGRPLPKKGTADVEVIDALARAAEQGTMASRGPRYFGFVVGGSLPVATAADWLVSAWDQNCGVYALSPFVSVVEEIAASWIREVVGLPASWSTGFVTGGVMANFTALAAARHHVLAAAGWDVEADGLFGAPPVTVIVSEEAHYTIVSSLRLLGLGGERVHRVPADGQGRMRVDALVTALGKSRGPCIVCAQAGNVNTGAFDPLDEIAGAVRTRGAWLHVDAAFGMWAAASPALSPLVAGITRADSIAADAHKWLNVPYDCGIVLCQHAQSHRKAMAVSAAYIIENPAARDPRDFVPEESRRARAVPVYAVLRTLGRDGLRDLVDRCCRLAQRMAERLRGHHAVSILNDVVLNQVLVRVGASQPGADQRTQDVIARVQQEGTCWLGGTTWQGKAAMRISVSNWSTTEADIDRSADAILRAVEETGAF